MVATLFVKIDKVQGDSSDVNHKDWVVVNSVNFAIERETEQEGGAATRGFGKASFKPMDFESELGKHSVKLMRLAASGQNQTKIIIHQCKSAPVSGSSAQAQVPYVKWVLEDAIIQGYTVASSADDIPKETWSIKFNSISCTTYGPKDNKPSSPLEKTGDFGWNTAEGQAAAAVES